MTTTGEGNGPWRERATFRPRAARGRDGGLRRVLGPARVRLQGARGDDGRDDGRGGPAAVRGRARRALRGPHEQPQRLRGPLAEDLGRRPVPGGPQAAPRHVQPRGPAGAPRARGGLDGGAGPGDVRRGRLHPEGRARVRGARRGVAVGPGGLGAVRGARRRGGGPPLARPGGPRVPVRLARRHLHEAPRGGPLRLQGAGRGHRDVGGRPQGVPRLRLRRRGVPRGLAGLPAGPAREGPVRGAPRRLSTAAPARSGPSRRPSAAARGGGA